MPRELAFIPLAVWLVLAASATAMITDLRARRIPNVLTAVLAAAAVGLHALGGPGALLVALATLCGVACLGFGAFAMRWLGGGDVKLLAGSAAMLGFPDSLAFLLYTAIGGGLFAIVVALASGRLRSVLASVVQLARPFVYRGLAPVAPARAIRLPYAVAIALGALAVAFSHSAAPFLRL